MSICSSRTHTHSSPQGKTVQAVGIYESKKIPRKFLETILLNLRKGGVLGSKKGKGGGYYLNKDPRTISLIEIVKLMDGAVAMLPCVSGNYQYACGMCTDAATCRIKEVFSMVRDQTVKVLSQTYLSDILEIKLHHPLLKYR